MEKTDIIIDGQTATWIMPATQGAYGGLYTGTFQFRCLLDPLRILQAGREYRELLGKNAILADESDADLAFALTQLKHRVLKSPPFWTSTTQDPQFADFAGNLPDLNIITLVLDAALRAEGLYKDKMIEEREAILNRSIKVAEKNIKVDQGKEPA